MSTEKFSVLKPTVKEETSGLELCVILVCSSCTL